MFLVPSDYKNDSDKIKLTDEQPVCLRSSHLILSKKIVESVFQNDKTVYLIYYPQKRVLMAAPYFNDLFRKIHKAKQYMLKEVSNNREAAIPLHGILLDNEIDKTDRYLDHKCESKINILSVYL